MSHSRWRLNLAYPTLSRLPCPLAWRTAAWMGNLGKVEYQQACTAVQNGFLAIFPELADDPRTLQTWTQHHLDMLAREFMDVFCMPRLQFSNIDRYIMLHGAELITEAKRESQGVILVLNHFSRLIMLLIRLGLMGIEMNILTMRIDDNPDLAPFMRHYLRTKVKRVLGFIRGQWLNVGDDLRPIYKGLQRGQIWIILADAYMPHFGDWRVFPFFGGQLRLPRGIERIASKTGARLIYGVTREVRPDLLACELRPLPTDPYEAMAGVVGELEKDIRATPWEWWQWNILDYLWTPTKQAQ